ncbi:gas vesicle protein [Halobacteriales archaeon QS_5_70_15]|nr:MAG: gas vesicle protein [Halobacteriales archaeon QS_5_70_15]
MRPTRSNDAVVDLLDVILRDGVVIEADVVVTVADVPLVGINLRAAVAGMTTMTRYGIFEEWGDDRPVDDGKGTDRTGWTRRDRVERANPAATAVRSRTRARRTPGHDPGSSSRGGTDGGTGAEIPPGSGADLS